MELDEEEQSNISLRHEVYALRVQMQEVGDSDTGRKMKKRQVNVIQRKNKTSNKGEEEFDCVENQLDAFRQAWYDLKNFDT